MRSGEPVAKQLGAIGRTLKHYLFTFFALVLLIVAIPLLAGCNESAATYRANEERDQRIKSAELDQYHSEERLQKQIDELRARIERLEK